jgi:hypothetical protein
VLGERDVRRTDTQDEGGVDLEVRVLGGEVCLVDGDEKVFLSSASTNSIAPFRTTSSKVISPFRIRSRSLSATRGLPSLTTIRGRRVSPRSV